MAYNKLACSSGRPRVEKIMFFSRLMLVLVRHLDSNSILDRLPDLSSLQCRDDPFCMRWWLRICMQVPPPCINKSPQPIHALRPPVEVRRPSSNVVITARLIFPSGMRVSVLYAMVAQDLYALYNHHHALLRQPKPSGSFVHQNTHIRSKLQAVFLLTKCQSWSP